MAKDIARRLVMMALLVLLTASGASCVTQTPGTEALPSPSAVPDPNPSGYMTSLIEVRLS